MKLEQVVPWGRSLSEYQQMFQLSEADLQLSILGCADGPASFNAEMNLLEKRVVSCDPIYCFSVDEIRNRVHETSAQITEYARQNSGEFNWSDSIPNPDALAEHRLKTMDRFLADYEVGTRDGRYVSAELPNLPFDEHAFDLVLCSHFLFLYSEQLSREFHVAAIREMLRVAAEVRIFPLLEMGAKPSRHLPAIVDALRAEGMQLTIETVDYEFQQGGNQMLRVRHDSRH